MPLSLALPVTGEQALGFALAALILIAIPGPSVVFVIGRALAYGQRVALASVLGNTLGLFAAMTLVSIGLGAVVAESLVVFTTLKLLGAGYLIWLGVQAIRHRSSMQVGAAAHPIALPTRTAIRQGFVVGIGNPKGFMIFAALLPQFVDPGRGHVPLAMFLLGLMAVLLGLVCDAVWALTAARMRSWFAGSARRGRAMGALGGTSMIGLGAALAFTEAPR